MKVGDIVCLKSGSPLMVVGHIAGSAVECDFWNPVQSVMQFAKCKQEQLHVVTSFKTPIYTGKDVPDFIKLNN